MSNQTLYIYAILVSFNVPTSYISLHVVDDFAQYLHLVVDLLRLLVLLHLLALLGDDVRDGFNVVGEHAEVLQRPDVVRL